MSPKEIWILIKSENDSRWLNREVMDEFIRTLKVNDIPEDEAETFIRKLKKDIKKEIKEICKNTRKPNRVRDNWIEYLHNVLDEEFVVNYQSNKLKRPAKKTTKIQDDKYRDFDYRESIKKSVKDQIDSGFYKKMNLPEPDLEKDE